MRRKLIGICMAALVCLNPLQASAQQKKAPKEDKQLTKLYSMTPEDFAASVDVRDDAMETVATFTTLNGFQYKNGLLKLVWSDHFLRAFVDKTDGTARFQVYMNLFEAGSGWPRFQSVNYLIPEGQLASVELDKLGSDVSCSGYTGCTYNETVAFNLSEDEMRVLARSYVSGGRVELKMRLKGQSGVSRDRTLTASEVAGLLQVVDAYRANLQVGDSEKDNTGQ